MFTTLPTTTMPTIFPSGEVSEWDVRDQFVLFPSLGHLDADGHWHIQVHGDVFSATPRVSLAKRFLLRMLQRSMHVPPEAMASEIFRRRIARFLANDGPGREICLQIGQQKHVLPNRSRRNGHFHATLRIPAALVAQHGRSTSGSPERLLVDICTPGDQGRACQGQVYLVGPRGLSIISDIDDTLKHTHVACRRTLLANTFLNEFQSIAGMADVFRGWAAPGVTFHYVSSSPWQLYENLAEHFLAEGLPEGSFHLRWFRLRDHLLRRLLLLRRSGKAAVIKSILKTFPQRQFVLVGDSGERDPEIYGALARKYPAQIAKVLIREIPGPNASVVRFQKAFRELPVGLTQLYREPAEIRDALDGLV